MWGSMRRTTRGMVSFALLLTIAVHCPSHDLRAEETSAPLKPEQAADAVTRALDAGAEDTLLALASNRVPDPWLVVAELGYRKAHDAAEAFAKAAAGPAVAKLPHYAASRRETTTDLQARKAWQGARKAYSAGEAEGALALLPREYPTDHVLGVQIAFWRALCLRALDRKEASTSAYVAAAEGAEAIGWLDRAGRAYDAAGRMQNALRNRKEALALFERGLSVMEAIDYPTGIGAILVNMGIVYQDQNRFAPALSLYERALRPMERSGSARGLATTLHRMGLTSSALGNYPKALGAYQRSLPLRKQLGDRAGWAGAQINIGNAYHALCRYPEALSHYELGLAEAKAIQHAPYSANALSNMAGVYRAVGNLPRALELVEQALVLRTASGDRAGLAHTLLNLGILYQDLGQFPLAAGFFARALSIVREIGDQPTEAKVLFNTGRLRHGEGDFAEAIALYEQARALASSLGDRSTVAWSIAGIGRSRIDHGERARGIASLKRAERDARQLRERDLLVWCLQHLAGTHLDDGETAQAMYLAREARTEVEYLLGGLGGENASTVRSRYAPVFAVGALASARLNDVAEAVTFLESGRAGALLEQLHGRDSVRWSDVSEGLRRTEIEARMSEVEARTLYGAALARGERAPIREAGRALDAAQSHVRSIANRIHREAKGQAAGLFYPRAATIEEIQASLRADQALVLYGICGEEVLAAVITADGGDVRLLGNSEAIDEACRTATLWDTDVDPTESVDALRSLLVAPLKIPKTVTQVLVSPEGPLCYVPFGMLFEQVVALTPSGTTHRLLAREKHLPGKGVLALGDPVYGTAVDGAHAVYGRGGALSPLPETRAEVEAIGDVVLLGTNANETDLREQLTDRRRWRSVHFACHGLVDRERPTLSSLALSRSEDEDGFLTALEVLRMDITADLAVLSACETGTGRIVPGEGIIGLTRAFMHAGAPSVLCSLWKVDDEATRALMIKFYELWNGEATPSDAAEGESSGRASKGLGPAAALKGAQAYVRDQEQWAHPHYWAAWVLWGLPR